MAMQTATTMLNQVQQHVQQKQLDNSSKCSSSSTHSTEDKQLASELKKALQYFNRIYGSAFLAHVSACTGGKVDLMAFTNSWVSEFARAGIDSSQIKYGLKKLSAERPKFPPNVYEFISYCKFEAKDYGLPSVSDAYRIAALSRTSIKEQREFEALSEAAKAVIEKTRCDVGYFEMSSRPQVELMPAFKAAYENNFKKYLRGEDISIQRVKEEMRIEKKPMTKEDRAKQLEEGRKHFAKLKDLVKLI